MRTKLPGEPGVKNAGRTDEKTAEAEVLMDKKYQCPICRTDFSSKGLKQGKAVNAGVDIDLFVRYKNIDAVKYRVISCPKCGYTAMDTDFMMINKHEAVALKKQLILKAGDLYEANDFRSFEEALALYRSALRCSLIKQGKYSERANIALNTAWLLRKWREKGGIYNVQTEPENEKKYLNHALKNFKEAEKLESFPIRNMSPVTFSYLMAALCYETGSNKEAYAYLIKVLSDNQAEKRIRIMAEELKEKIR
ncbi:MAG: DUF2225 domain-containing protein [Lachnospiraceae bacterium]|nr:DUF2225 domain-containing protein [Lachnospiraceae bacterium]